MVGREKYTVKVAMAEVMDQKDMGMVVVLVL